jgi:tRNA nucleotidyltransferase/poly(A) polymerase
MKRLNALRQLRSTLGAEVFLVGGTVRDLIRRKTPRDLDVLVRNVAPADFQEFLAERGSLQLVGSSFGVYLFKPRGSKEGIEIAFPRTEVSTGPGHREFAKVSDPGLSIEEDSRRRDFTLNAMYLDIDNVGEGKRFSREMVIDFQNGMEHIRRKLIVAVGDPDARIREDPLRMLRALVLIARTGYRLDLNTFNAIRRNAKLISTVSAERVRDEVVKIMEADKPSRAFKAMVRTGLLELVIPELAAGIGCGQNPRYHSYPVFEHLIYATDGACSVTDRLDVRFAALCHDFGKVSTRAERPGGEGPDDVSFHNHELASTKLTFDFLNKLKFPRDFVERVVHLVRWHQYKYDRLWTDKAVRRFIRKCGVEQEHLADLDQFPQFLLRQADRLGNELKARLPITVKQRDFQVRIKEVYAKSSAHSLRDLKVSGNDLKEALGVPASPRIGRILDHLFDIVEEDPALNTRELLLEAATRYLEKEESTRISE